MTGAVELWWVWLAAALVLGLAEVLLPGFIFLGFAIAAAIMSGVVLLLPELGTSALLAVYGALAVLCWIGLRFAFRKQSTNAKTFTDDVND